VCRVAPGLVKALAEALSVSGCFIGAIGEYRTAGRLPGESVATREGASRCVDLFARWTSRLRLLSLERTCRIALITRFLPGIECRRSLETRYLAVPRAATASGGQSRTSDLAAIEMRRADLAARQSQNGGLSGADLTRPSSTALSERSFADRRHSRSANLIEARSSGPYSKGPTSPART